jgi:hypothetical protein
MSANEILGSILLIFFPATPVGADATTVPFLANAEANIFAKPIPNVILRGFVGLNYDSRVPGISAPVMLSVFGTPGIPAGIKFQAETSYYGGGGIVVKFGHP